MTVTKKDAPNKKSVFYVVLAVMTLSFLILTSSAQLNTEKVDFWSTCVNVITEHEKPLVVYDEERVVYHVNGTEEVVKDILRIDVEYYNTTETVCYDTMTYEDKPVLYEKQGYKCKGVSNGVVCDSCLDGNCDGKCDKNGGETCVFVHETGKVIHKNSIESWTNTPIYVKELRIR